MTDEEWHAKAKALAEAAADGAPWRASYMDMRKQRDAAEARLADELRTHVAEWQAEADARATAEKERDLALVRAENAEARLAEAVAEVDRRGQLLRVSQPSATLDPNQALAWYNAVAHTSDYDARPSPAPTAPAPGSDLRMAIRLQYHLAACRRCSRGGPMCPQGDRLYRESLREAEAATEAPAPGTEQKERTK